MKCPVCTDADLLMTERLGIEIDYCPKCRGVWLDRGELDKIIEHSQGPAVNPTAAPQPSPFDTRFGHGRHDEHHGHGQSYHGKKSIWQELFD